MWKYKFVLVETGMVRTVRYILLIRSIFVRLFKIESLRIRFRLWNWIEGPKELFFFFFWDFADFKRIQIEPYSRKDHLEIILTNEKTNWPIVEQEQFQQKRFLLITRGQAQDNTTANPQATRLISKQLEILNVNFEIIVCRVCNHCILAIIAYHMNHMFYHGNISRIAVKLKTLLEPYLTA